MATSYVVNNKAVREDLLDLLTSVYPSETQLISGFATSTAKSTRHEWLEDLLAAVKDNANAEGSNATYHTLTNPQRLLNYTQISKQGYEVSDTERAVDTAAFNDRFSYEAQKALRLLKNDMEYAIMRGSLACGASAVVGKVKGIKNWLSVVTSQSGVSLSESQFNDYLQNVWNLGTEVNAAYVPMTIKRRIAGWVGNATAKNVDVSDKRLTNSVNVYEADAAKMVKLFPHRYVSIAGTDTNHDIVGINEDMFKVAYLRKPFTRELAKTSDSSKGEIVTEYTLECLSGYAGFKAIRHK